MKGSRTYRKELPAFGAWLLSELKAARISQGEFADRIGVSSTTVSRWVNGRVPDGVFINAIAKELHLDYDLVAELAGYRPTLPRDALDRMHDQIDGYLMRVVGDPTHERIIVGLIRGYVEGVSPQEGPIEDDAEE